MVPDVSFLLGDCPNLALADFVGSGLDNEDRDAEFLSVQQLGQG